MTSGIEHTLRITGNVPIRMASLICGVFSVFLLYSYHLAIFHFVFKFQGVGLFLLNFRRGLYLLNRRKTPSFRRSFQFGKKKTSKVAKCGEYVDWGMMLSYLCCTHCHEINIPQISLIMNTKISFSDVFLRGSNT